MPLAQHAAAPGEADYFAREPWKAQLELALEAFAAAAGGAAAAGTVTRLVHNRHQGPIRIQKPFYPEGIDGPCHLLLVHPPGGLASGDVLNVQLRLAEGTALVVSTPGAGKWYRSFGHAARQSIAMQLGAGATLEWLPQEAIVFDHAQARAVQRIDLHAQAAYLGWDILCLGRQAGNEPFASGSYRAALDLRVDGRCLWRERAALDGGSALLQSPVGLAGRRVAGTLIASTPGLRMAPGARVDAGAADGALARAALEAVRAVAPRAYGDELLAGATLLPAGLLLRALAAEPERLRAYFAAVRRALRPLLFGRPAADLRIWNT